MFPSCVAGLDGRFLELERPCDWRVCVRREVWSFFTSVRSCSISASSSGKAGAVVAETVGVDTSTTLSASSASSSSVAVVLVEASTIRTFEGNRWRNSSLRNVLSVMPAWSPNSCCMRRNNRPFPLRAKYAWNSS